MTKTIPITGTPKVPQHKRLAAGEQVNGKSLGAKPVKMPSSPKTPA